MTRLFCGHHVNQKLYAVMYQAKRLRCPTCGLEWRGWMVMERDKGQAKRELREAERMGKMTGREFFKGDRRPRQ